MMPAQQLQQHYSAQDELARVPRAPRTPSKRAKRLIFAYAGGQAAMLWIGIAFLAMGSLFSAVFCWGLPADLAIGVAGIRTKALVVGSEVNTHVKINGAHPTTVRFRYQVDGVSREAATDTMDYALAGLAPDSEVEVELLPAKPEWARLAGQTYNSFGYGVVFVLIFPLLGAALLFAAVRSNRREIQAFTHGVPVLARVVYAGPDTSTKINGRHPFKLEWEFRSQDGEVATGSLSSMKLLELEEYMKASEVVVLYDPQKPASNTLWVS